jgi:hypothetical protein
MKFSWIRPFLSRSPHWCDPLPDLSQRWKVTQRCFYTWKRLFYCRNDGDDASWGGWLERVSEWMVFRHLRRNQFDYQNLNKTWAFPNFFYTFCPILRVIKCFLPGLRASTFVFDIDFHGFLLRLWVKIHCISKWILENVKYYLNVLKACLHLFDHSYDVYTYFPTLFMLE